MPTVDVPAVVETYVRAWHERNPTERRRLLEASWADGGVYTDPNGTIEGRDELDEAIASFHEQRPDVRIEVRSRIDAFDTQFRFLWATVDGSGKVLREGIDFGQVASDGRISLVVGFFGLLP